MLVKNFPLTEVVKLPMNKETYTKEEVDALIKYAIGDKKN